MDKKYDIVIIGGGIFGCAAAYQICSRSDLKVAIVERGMMGMETTSLAASLITRARPLREQTELVIETYSALLALEATLDESFDFNFVGSLHIAQSEQSAQSILQQAEILKEIGDNPQELTLQEAKKMAPWLSLDKAELIMHNPLDGFIDPYRLTAAYLKGAKAHGNIDIYQSTEVHDLEISANTVTGVETSRGLIKTDQVVVAAGPWANRLLKKIGSASAMAPVRSHYWMTGTNPIYPEKSPVLIMPEANAYARPEVGGLLFGLRDQISTWAHPKDLPDTLQGFSFDDDNEGWGALEQAVGPFLGLCPSLEEVEIHHYISGPSCYTPDGKYLIGPAPNLNGVFLASGCCGAGVAISGGLGKSIAELVMGQTPSIDLTAFAPSRFDDFDPYDDKFLERCAQSRSMKKAG